MKNALIQMKSIDPETFLTGIFSEELSLAHNSLVPVVVAPESFGLDEEFQTLPEAFDLLKKVNMTFWPSFLGPIALGQYAARKQVDLFAFARNDIVFRKPTVDEVARDAEHFGKQVMGPEVADDEDLEETQAVVLFYDKAYFYTGPPRMTTATLTARIIERTGIPNDEELAELRKQIDGDYGEPKNSVQQGLFAVSIRKSHTNSAEVHLLGGENFKTVEPEKMQFLGSVQVVEDRKQVLFYPEGDIGKCIDFSVNYWEGHIF